MAIKTVEEIKVKFGTIELGVISVPHDKTETIEDVEITTLGDRVKKFRPGSVKEVGEFSIDVRDVATLPEIGATDTVQVVASNNNGTATTEETVTIGKCYVKSVTPTNIDGSSRNKDWTIVFRPTGD